MMQRIKEYINTHGLCKEAGDKNIEIHSQNGKHGNAGGKKNTVHSQYHAPRDMVERYVNVAKLVGGKDYIIRAVSMFVSRDDPKTTLTSSADRKMFLKRHMDTDCLLTLFVEFSNDESRVIYDIDNVVFAKLTNPAGVNITVTNGIHSGKKSQMSRRKMNIYKSNTQWINFVKEAIPIIWPKINLD